MQNQSLRIGIPIAVLAAVLLGTEWFRDFRSRRENARIESLIAPVVSEAVAATPGPRPELSFAVTTGRSALIIVRWDQAPGPEFRNDIRERILAAVRRELAADPKSWGRHVSIAFQDELVTQGWK